jgi:sugar phosphate isomerase/epimerase
MFKINAFADEAGNDFEEQLKALGENKLDGMEIRNLDGQNVVGLSVEKAKEVRDRLSDKGLSVWSIGSPIGKIGITDPFDEHLDLFKHSLDIAQVLGASAYRMFSFYMPKDAKPELYKDEVLERLYQLCEAAKNYNIILCHENEKDIYGDTASRCLEIHREIPQIRAVFDPANFIQCGQDTLAAWEMLEPYIEYMHIKDALSDGSVVPAGKGEGNIPVLLEKYKKIGGKVLTLEPHLKVFAGLETLERVGSESVVGKYEYPSNRVAFDAAVAALKEIL